MMPPHCGKSNVELRRRVTMIPSFETLKTRAEGSLLHVTIDAPPINMLGPELVRDLVDLITEFDRSEEINVAIFKSANTDFFISHVDVTKVAAYRQEAARLTGEASIGMLFRRLSETKVVTIAQVEGRARGAGSEFALACDMRFAARETAIFAQFESSFGLTPGAGGMQHLVRLLGRGRALEALLTADDYGADLAERYGWINRAIPSADLDAFTTQTALRIASFPPFAAATIKSRVNAAGLAPEDDFRIDSDLFGKAVGEPEVQRRMKLALHRGFQTRDPELALGEFAGRLYEVDP
jgi:enoyl-CoA hydratase/carnithine racemase